MQRDIELIIFDLDGTLVDSRQDISNAINFMLDKLGMPQKTPDEIISYVGHGILELIDRSLRPREVELREKGLDIFKSYHKAHPADYAYLYPGVEDTLDYFKNKQMAVITNRNHNSSVIMLKKMGIYSYFDDVIGDDNTSCLKPSRCQFDRLLNKKVIRDRKKVIMVGDMDVDIIAGRASGVITCVTTYGFGEKKDLEKAKPDYMIDDISKLKDIIV